MPTFSYYRPTSLAEAFRLRAELPEARFVAGGTDVLSLFRDKKIGPPALISLRRVRELNGIAAAPGQIRIGAVTRVADVAASAQIRRRLPALAQGAGRLGSAQIRNVATIGGNLCNASPCADLAPPLLVYEARVRIEGPNGARELALDDFFAGKGVTRLGQDEVLAAVVVDDPEASARSRFDKLVRVRMDIALASAAVLVAVGDRTITRARVAMGSLAPRPMRLSAVERFLEGRTPGAEVARDAGALAKGEVTPIDDQRATAAYRRHVAGVLVERAVRDLTERGAA